MGRNLILGMATGYSPATIQPFLQSLTAAKFSGKVVLFVYKRQSKKILKFVESNFPECDLSLVTVHDIGELGKFAYDVRRALFHLAIVTARTLGWHRQARLDATRVSRERRHHRSTKPKLLCFFGLPYQTRYFHYREYITTHPEYSFVLLSDVRDVIFQTDPFSELSGTGLYVGIENTELTIGEEPTNRRWIINVYDEAMAERIGSCHVSCAGVTLGDVFSVREYLNKMVSDITKIPLANNGRFVNDQAIHNKLLHNGELETKLYFCEPLKSKIATLGFMKRSDFIVNDEGILLNHDGRPASIVHQYDRHPALVNAFRTRFACGQ